jgi:hypothetical protein
MRLDGRGYVNNPNSLTPENGAPGVHLARDLEVFEPVWTQ